MCAPDVPEVTGGPPPPAPRSASPHPGESGRRVGATLARLVLGTVLTTGLATGLAACGSTGTADPTAGAASPVVGTTPTTPPATTTSPPTSTGPRVHYVALGDSYVSAPGLPTVIDKTCDRSDHNYPHLVAAADPAITLDDQSCSGAPTADVVGRQAEALSSKTDLVTVGIGDNDGNVFGTLYGQCPALAAQDPTGAPCAAALQNTVDATFTTTGPVLDAMLQTLAQKAPKATIVVVGYPQPLPTSGSCPDRTAIAAGDYAFVNAMIDRVNQALSTAAAAHGDPFIDVWTASQGHDICSADPWINGQDTAPDGVIAYHPLAAEQNAVAALVEGELGSLS